MQPKSPHQPRGGRRRAELNGSAARIDLSHQPQQLGLCPGHDPMQFLCRANQLLIAQTPQVGATEVAQRFMC
jgi:hypothetical protein